MNGWISMDDARPPKAMQTVLAAIHHGRHVGYVVCEARVYPNGLHHVSEGSCVGWRKGHEHPAFWQPMPTFEPPMSMMTDARRS